jgi:hypothetical protein
MVLQIPAGYVVAVILFLLVLLLYKLLSQKEATAGTPDSRNFFRLKSPLNFVRSTKIDFVVPLVYFAAVIAVIIIPQNNSLWLDWTRIQFLNWLRLAAGFLLTSFLPGYVILKAIDIKHAIKGVAARIVFSYVLSFLVTMAIGVALEFSGYKISEYGFSVVILTSISFLILLLFLNFRLARKQTYSSSVEPQGKDYVPPLILICLIALQCVLLYIVFFTNQSFLRGDMWSHFADATNLLKYGLQTQSTLSGYFWGYRIYNAVFLVLGGFPLINAEVTLIFLYPISIIAFYAMVSLFFKSRLQKVPILAATIWAIFSGFDWVYLVIQGLVPGKFSFDAFYPVVSKTMSGVIYPYGTFGYDHLLYMVSIISIFVIIYLFKCSMLKTSARVFLIAAATLVGYTVHPVEVMLFIALFVPALLIFSKDESFSELRKNLVSMLFGLVVVLFLDFLSPEKLIYTSLYDLPVSIILVCLAISLTYFFKKFSLRKNFSKVLVHKHTQKMLIFFSFILCYLYFLSFIMLSTSPLSSQGFSIGTLWYVIPWFAYSLRLGVAGILLIASIFYITIKRKFSETILFFLAVTFFSVIFGTLYANFYSPLTVISNNDRIFYVMFIAVSIVAAWIVPKIFSKITSSNLSSSLFRKISRNLIASIFLVIIIVGGSLSSIISSEYWAAASGPLGFPQNNMPQDISALSYLKANSPTLSPVITNAYIQAQVLQLANVQSLDNDQFDNWFRTTQPEVLFTLKNLWNVHYAYLSSDDLKTIIEAYPESYFLNNLIKYLPKITFNDSDISIYELPSLFPPSGKDLAIIIPSTSDENLLFSIETFASSGLQYNLCMQQDPNMFEASTIVLPFDPTPSNSSNYSIIDSQSLSESQIAEYTNWLDSGGHLIVFDNSGNVILQACLVLER